MLLKNIYTVSSEKPESFLVKDDRINAIYNGNVPAGNCPQITFDHAFAFPGLINSHDHLEFNLFPQLGNKTYRNYIDWGADIHKNSKKTIEDVLNVPLDLRIMWGIYKNLLNGVTTVIHHGRKLETKDDIITIRQEHKHHSLHSVKLERNWKYKLNRPLAKSSPFVIHAGEGTDAASSAEIDTLLKWNLLNRHLVAVHGIAMNEEQAKKFKALVWCPDSNYFLTGNTAQIDKLKTKTNIVFGTDSTVSSSWNMWNHLRLALSLNKVSAEELFNTLTSVPAKVWGIAGCGTLKENSYADIVIARKKDKGTGLKAFFNLNPQDIILVMHKGLIRLFDIELYGQLNTAGVDISRFSKIETNGGYKYVYGNIEDLINSTRKYFPTAKLPIPA